MLHRIVVHNGPEAVWVDWDDATGAVASSDDTLAYQLRRQVADPPGAVGGALPNFRCEDPAHDAADFLALLIHAGRLELPDSLVGAAPVGLPDETPSAEDLDGQLIVN